MNSWLMLFSVCDHEESAMSDAPFRSGLLVFPNLTQLDLIGPYETHGCPEARRC